MRAAASLNGRIVTTFAAGQICEPLAKPGAWRHLRCGVHEGFVHRICLTAHARR